MGRNKTANQTTTNSTNPTQLPASLQIPKDTYIGDASIIASTYSGTYQNTSIPAGENPSLTSESTATPIPTTVENTVSLFAWLLIAVGFFTFTALYLFLKIKLQPKPETQKIPFNKPNITPTTTPPPPPPPPPPPAPSPAILETTPTTTTKNSTLQQPSLTAAIAPEKTMSATLTTDTQIKPIEIEATTTENSEPASKSEASSEINPEKLLGMQMELDKIESTKKRIEPIQQALELEKTQLNQDIQKLNEIMNEREKAINNYIAVLRQQAEKAKKYINQQTMQDQLNEDNANAQQDSKLNLEKASPSEPTLQAVLNQMSKVSSTSKRVQALKTTLESEKERLNTDIKDVIQTVEDREQALKNYFDKIKKQIKQQRTDSTEQEK